MGRLKKNIVDYFPHPVRDGDRMRVMENKYKHVGYCCWYKTLQLLGRTANHRVDFSDRGALMRHAGSVDCTEELLMAMLTDLAEMGAINKKPWVESRIVFSDEFMESIAHVYTNRRVEPPTLLDNYTGKSADDDQSTPQNDIVKESIVKDSKVKKKLSPIDQTSFDLFWILYDKKVGKETAEGLWAKVKEDDRKKIMEVVPKYKVAQPEKQYRKNPATFLRNKSWNDEIIQAPVTGIKAKYPERWSRDFENSLKTNAEIQAYWKFMREEQKLVPAKRGGQTVAWVKPEDLKNYET